MSVRSTAGIRRTLRALPRTPAQPEQGSVRLEEVEEESKIPTKYYIVQKFPLVPHEYSTKGYKIYFKDGFWNVILWPSTTSNYKDEIRYLRNAVDKMMEDVETTPVDESENVKGLQVVMKKAELLEIALRELNRQITREHSERGELMTYILDKYTELFNELPNLYNNTIIEVQKEFNLMKKNMDQSSQSVQEREIQAAEEVRSAGEKAPEGLLPGHEDEAVHRRGPGGQAPAAHSGRGHRRAGPGGAGRDSGPVPGLCPG